MPLLALALGLSLLVTMQHNGPGPVQGVRNGVTAPVLIKSVAPKYPHSFFHKAPAGITMVDLKIGRDGVPQDVHVAASSGNDKLDQSAIAAVQQYRFKPAMRDGQPVPVAMKVEVNFRIY